MEMGLGLRQSQALQCLERLAAHLHPPGRHSEYRRLGA